MDKELIDLINKIDEWYNTMQSNVKFILEYDNRIDSFINKEFRNLFTSYDFEELIIYTRALRDKLEMDDE
ncbi:hypothetical protein EBQ81_00925 [bacterium]|nr:hypothetical protein [bacterium]